MNSKPDNNTAQLALEKHHQLKGKIGVYSKAKLIGKKEFSTYYTPGVGAVSTYLSKNKDKTREYTIKGNSVAIVSDGSAVLGLGNIGPEAALPVMEGKAMILSQFAGIDAFPIVLSTQEPEKIIETVINISPTFGGIILEDIAAPQCFQIEKILIDALDIPVVHDDQHGTSVVVLAALINSLKVVKRDTKNLKVVIIGAGAAGSAVARLLVAYGISHVIAVDSQGIIGKNRRNLDANKKDLARLTNPKNITGGLLEALEKADVAIGLSTGGNGKITPPMIKAMSKKPIIFALANPNPEIMPQDAIKAGAYIVATGRSDFPNQINNSLAFPGVFRGALDNKVTKITTAMRLAAAEKLAAIVKNPTTTKIIPSTFDKAVVKQVASAIKNH